MQFKRNCIIAAIAVTVIALTGCSTVSINDVQSDSDNANTKKTEYTSAKKSIDFEGEYVSDDGNDIIIVQNGDTFDISINIVRLACIENGISKIISEDEIEFTAKDPCNNDISIRMFWKNKDEVTLVFTESTYEYLPKGTVMELCRVNTDESEYNDYEDLALQENYETTHGENPMCISGYIQELESTFTGYINKKGNNFLELTNPEALIPYCVRFTGNMQYYLDLERVAVGVENDDVKVVAYHPSDLVGITSPSVRETINKMDVPDMFEIEPQQIKLGSNSSYSFFYWKAQNGYIGFATIGNGDKANCYGNAVSMVVFFENLDCIIHSAGNNSGNILKAGDSFSITGIVGYSEEPSDIGSKYCYVTEDTQTEYIYEDFYDIECRLLENVFYTKLENDTALLKKHVGQKVTISGIFNADCHGIPYITNIDIQ